jgi:hypothetical protein
MFQSEISWLKATASLNIIVNDSPAPTSHASRGWLKEAASRNILANVVAELVSQAFKGWLKP